VVIAGFPLRFFNYRKFAPPAKPLCRVLLLTIDRLERLSRRPRTVRGREKAVTSRVLARLEKHYAVISAKVNARTIATPIHHVALHVTTGPVHGWSPTPKACARMFKKTLPGLE